MTATTKTTASDVQSIQTDASRIIGFMVRVEGMSGHELDPVVFKKLDRLIKEFRSEIIKYQFMTNDEYVSATTSLSRAATTSSKVINDIRVQLSKGEVAPKDICDTLSALLNDTNKMCVQAVELTQCSRGIPLDVEIDMAQFFTAARYLPLSVAAWKKSLNEPFSSHALAALDEKIHSFGCMITTLCTYIPVKA